MSGVLDQDAVIAASDLVKRSGARQLEIGYLDDEPPHRWYAHARFRGALVTVEDKDDPAEAVEGLARRLLTGALCRRCGKPIRLNDDDPGCRWTRNGRRWEPGCGRPIDQSIPTRPF